MRHFWKNYLFVGSRRFSHAAIEQCAEVLRPGGQQRASGIYRLVLNEESDICKGWVVEQLPQIINQVARGDGDRLKTELVEVVEHNTSIVAAEHIQRIVEHL